MATRKPTPERVGAFSEGVLAIIITIMAASAHSISNQTWLSGFKIG